MTAEYIFMAHDLRGLSTTIVYRLSEMIAATYLSKSRINLQEYKYWLV